jgi:hypothetical protein
MLICGAVWWSWQLRQAKVAVVTFALLAGCMSAHAEVASIYGDGLCGHLTASGERFCGWHGGGQAMAATLLCFRKSTLVFTAP